MKNTHGERGLGTGCKDKVRDRLVRMTDEFRDRLVNRMERAYLEREGSEKNRRTNFETGF